MDTLFLGTRGRSDCTIKTGAVTIPIKVSCLQFVLRSFYWQGVLSTEEHKYLHDKTSSYLRSLPGKIQVTGPSLTSGHTFHPVGLGCHEIVTEGAQNLPTPICDSKHPHKDLFPLGSLGHFISSARQNPGSPALQHHSPYMEQCGMGVS